MNVDVSQQFVRIAMARLISKYPNDKQRMAVACKMYVLWKEKKNKKNGKSNI
jgi:hypothetical protein